MDFTKDNSTSVKVRHAPGGKSSFSLAWDTEPVKPTKFKPTPTQQPLAPQTNVNQPTQSSTKTT